MAALKCEKCGTVRLMKDFTFALLKKAGSIPPCLETHNGVRCLGSNKPTRVVRSTDRVVTMGQLPGRPS